MKNERKTFAIPLNRPFKSHDIVTKDSNEEGGIYRNFFNKCTNIYREKFPSDYFRLSMHSLTQLLKVCSDYLSHYMCFRVIVNIDLYPFLPFLSPLQSRSWTVMFLTQIYIQLSSRQRGRDYKGRQISFE